MDTSVHATVTNHNHNHKCCTARSTAVRPIVHYSV